MASRIFESALTAQNQTRNRFHRETPLRVRHRSAALAQRCILDIQSVRNPLCSQKFRIALKPSQLSNQTALIGRARTESGDMLTGTSAPPFQLLEPATGRLVSLSQLSEGASATLVMWWCNHCPFVIHLKEPVVGLLAEFGGRRVTAVAISSNSVRSHPQDGPEEMAQDAKRYGYTFPYLHDATQEVAKAYSARCTPEFFVFDRDMKLQYHGQFAGSRPSNGLPITGDDLRAALEDVLSERSVQRPVKPSIGCSIKWHPTV